MNYALYAIAGIVLISTIFVIATTGQPRKPNTPGNVVIITLINAAVIVVLVIAGMRYGS